jgi:hypothetical protein
MDDHLDNVAAKGTTYGSADRNLNNEWNACHFNLKNAELVKRLTFVK